MVSSGFGPGGGSNQSRLDTQLVPRKKRPLPPQQVALQLRPPLLRYPGFRAFVTLPPALQIGGRMGNSSYQVTVQSLNTDVLYEWAGKLDQALADLPELQDVSNDMEMKSPRVNLVIDRDKAAAVGLNATQVENALYDGLGPKWSSTIYGASAQYRVLIELDPKYQEHTDSLRKIAFKTSRGTIIPLESVVHFRETVGPNSINHSGQLP